MKRSLRCLLGGHLVQLLSVAFAKAYLIRRSLFHMITKRLSEKVEQAMLQMAILFIPTATNP